MFHKRWKHICELGRFNHFLMMGFATLDTATVLGYSLARGLLHYFSETEEEGPVPLSVLKQVSRDVALDQGWSSNEEIHPDVLKNFNIPSFQFAWGENHLANKGLRDPLPDDLDPKPLSLFEVVEWRGQKFFVAGIDLEGEVLVIAPAERIALDL
jgi:hypothetical protein